MCPEELILNEIARLEREKLPLYKIVADNIDLEVVSRIQGKGKDNRSIHWTHQFALLDRALPSHHSPETNKTSSKMQFIQLLPDAKVQENLLNRMAVLSPYQCCLDVEFFNPNIAGEMAQLMQKNQSKYVPLSADGKDVVSTVPFHGDQLLEERARNVKWTFQEGDNSCERIEGLEPEFADWHAKFTLYKAENKLFVNHDSLNEIGTSMASMYRTGKKNASKDVHNHYNEYSEFHTREIEGHICAAFMEKMGVTKMDDKPNIDLPDSHEPKSQRGKWLHDKCREFAFQSEAIDIADETLNLENNQSPFKCRANGCEKSYMFHSGRVSHESKVHNDHQDDKPKPDSESKPTSKQDFVFNYHQAKLAFGLVLFEFNDCIKEGDGERLYELYKLALLLFKSFGHTKYAYAVLLYLTKINYILTTSEAFRLKFNRFYNHHGGKGKNIPLDLRKEQQNRLLKTLWKGLGANLNEKNASRIASSLELQDMMISSVDKDCELEQREGRRSNPHKEEAVTQITSDLVNTKAFKFTPGRKGYEAFPEFGANIIKLDYRDLHKWIKDHLKLWESVYGFQQ
ncbi:hypothetical protein AC249_AIPGENE23166 [Exaiptasia diaphana]|nr:hypothetical protein AC249_AIPGENE23166 [Exaiptasia diaphana]